MYLSRRHPCVQFQWVSHESALYDASLSTSMNNLSNDRIEAKRDRKSAVCCIHSGVLIPACSCVDRRFSVFLRAHRIRRIRMGKCTWDVEWVEVKMVDGKWWIAFDFVRTISSFARISDFRSLQVDESCAALEIFWSRCRCPASTYTT